MKFLIKVFFTLILFFFIYNPPISVLPMNTGIIIGGLFFVSYLGNLIVKIFCSKSILLSKRLLHVLFLIVFIALYSFMVSIVSGSGDIQPFKTYFSFLLFFIPGSFGIVHWMRKYYSSIEVIKILIGVFVLQSMVILFMLVNPAVKTFLFSVLRDGSARIEKNLASGGFRFLGFAYNTTWDLSIVQSMGIMSIALLFKIDKTEINIKNTLSFILLAISVFLTGRTGFFGIMFAILIIIIPNTLKGIPFSVLLRFLGKIFVVCIPLVFLVKSFLPSSVMEIIDKNVLPWAFEMFQNDSGGKLETASSNEVKTMYFTPPLKTLLIGDGYYVNPYDNTRYYMDTDVGYMRHILFYGIVGLLLIASIYISIFYQMFIFSSSISESVSVKIFVVLLGLYYFVSHLKGDLFLGSDIPIKALFTFYAVFYFYKDSNKTKLI
ncbi:hypothetical protein HDF26_001960 [Pedobacter cryoconitis]|uniref:hypothetical protein n=1 Tax=Pedobacter cryoconitis TaxID=188932 RepID=UPI00161E25ED|nr:hypothetical protein [Pedobacter cryoconitis]MBB6271533.1 hypothetical protein [Pedobacter cryoconitis]